MDEHLAPRPLSDDRALTILTTEHWSLLSARGLVYNEAFARAGTFLTFLSATLVALGLIAAGTGFRREFLVVAATVLALDLFIGLATLGRVMDASAEDIRCIQGMNRLRHAYLEMVPGLEPYFVTSRYDDMAGAISAYGAASPSTLAGTLHGLTTTSGMVCVICAAVAAALAGVLLLLATDEPAVAAVGAFATLLVGVALGIATMVRVFGSGRRAIEPIFPTPSR